MKVKIIINSPNDPIYERLHNLGYTWRAGHLLNAPLAEVGMSEINSITLTKSTTGRPFAYATYSKLLPYRRIEGDEVIVNSNTVCDEIIIRLLNANEENGSLICSLNKYLLLDMGYKPYIDLFK